MSSAWLVVHSDSHPGCTWTDPIAVFLDGGEAHDYLDRLREREGSVVDDDGWTDSQWRVVHLPVLKARDDLPEMRNFRWVVA